jgi:hypothetical protein
LRPLTPTRTSRTPAAIRAVEMVSDGALIFAVASFAVAEGANAVCFGAQTHPAAPSPIKTAPARIRNTRSPAWMLIPGSRFGLGVGLEVVARCVPPFRRAYFLVPNSARIPVGWPAGAGGWTGRCSSGVVSGIECLRGAAFLRAGVFRRTRPILHSGSRAIRGGSGDGQSHDVDESLDTDAGQVESGTRARA